MLFYLLPGVFLLAETSATKNNKIIILIKYLLTEFIIDFFKELSKKIFKMFDIVTLN